MKKWMGALLGMALLGMLCFSVSAEEYVRENAGMTICLPESYEGIEGTVYIDTSDPVGEDDYFVPVLYSERTREEVEQMIEEYNDELHMYPIAFLFNMDAEDAQERLKELMDTSSFPEYTMESVKEEDGRAIIYCVPPLEEGATLDEAHEEVFNSLQEKIGDLIAASSFYVPVNPYDKLVGTKVEFETVDFDGNPVSSQELFAGHDVTMINIWASWCTYCIQEMKELSEMNEALEARGGAIVGLLEDGNDPECLEIAKGIVEENEATYTNIIVPDNFDDIFYLDGYPCSYFVDQDGVILDRPVSGAYVEKYKENFDKYLGAAEGEEAAPEEAEEEAAPEEAEEDAAPEEAGEEEPKGDAVANDAGAYRVFVKDEAGEPVPGVAVQFCSDVQCTLGKTDDQGVAVFEFAPGTYTAHILKAPEGYAKDPTEYKLLDTYSDLTVVLKAE